MIKKEVRTINDKEVHLFFDTDQQAYLVASDAMEVFLQSMQDLRQYENDEKQGLLLRLPCAEGATVYIIKNNADACVDCRYFEKGYYCEDYCGNKNVKDEDGHSYPTYPQYSDNPLCEKHFLEVAEGKSELDWIYRNREIFGKSIFFTKEEAEQALQALEGKR